MRRFGVILTDQGKSITVRINPESLQEQRKDAYDCYATHYMETMLFSKNDQNQVISESVVLVPLPMRINTLNYEG